MDRVAIPKHSDGSTRSPQARQNQSPLSAITGERWGQFTALVARFPTASKASSSVQGGGDEGEKKDRLEHWSSFSSGSFVSWPVGMVGLVLVIATTINRVPAPG